MRRFFYTIAFLSLAGTAVHAQEFDDIYYNPKKDNSSVSKKNTKSNYIQDFSQVDVDEYNRRGQYYESPIDTVGLNAENGEDFVYTQKIQKFYNPTIVVENSSVLFDVLDNSYGNVEIVFNDGLPYFNSIYGWPGYFNYSTWAPAWRWNYAIGPNWAYTPLWGWEYWPSWSLGPAWAWGPSFGWSWGPTWAWAPGWNWGPSWGGWGRPYYADYRPYGRQPNYPGSNWANNTRPGGNVGGNSSRPGYSGAHASNNGGYTSRNYHRNSQSYAGTAGNRVNGSTSVSNRGSYSVGNDGHRRYGTSSNSGSSSSGYHRSSSSTRQSSSSNHSSSSSYSNSSHSSGRSSSYSSGGSGSHRSSGGSYGGGRTSSGSGRGRR